MLYRLILLSLLTDLTHAWIAYNALLRRTFPFQLQLPKLTFWPNLPSASNQFCYSTVCCLHLPCSIPVISNPDQDLIVKVFFSILSCWGTLKWSGFESQKVVVEKGRNRWVFVSSLFYPFFEGGWVSSGYASTLSSQQCIKRVGGEEGRRAFQSELWEPIWNYISWYSSSLNDWRLNFCSGQHF